MAFRTDLAVEAIENMAEAADTQQVRQSGRTIEGFDVNEVDILTEYAAREIGKPCGRYLTLELDALIRREEDAFPRACHALSSLLRELLPAGTQAGPVLVAGLGNRMITPDAVGPQAVDALAAGRLSRLLRTVQLADTGITPGAGVGNARAALNERTLGVPVIAVGVPTVVDGATLAHEIAAQLGGPSCEALEDLSRPVMITTRDIDREIADVSRMIGYAVNMALHPHLTVEDVDLYLS